MLRAERGVLIVETRHGFVCANAGIDSSNLPEAGTVCLLPEDPDASARRIRAEIRPPPGPRSPSIVADSFGRAWRLGQAEVAIGCAGLAPLDDWRGRRDAGGRELEATLIAVADEAAAAADLVRDKAQRRPRGDRPRPRPLRHRGRRPRRRGPAPPPRRGPLPLSRPACVDLRASGGNRRCELGCRGRRRRGGGRCGSSRAPRWPPPAGRPRPRSGPGPAAPARGTPRRRGGSGWRPSRASARPRGSRRGRRGCRSCGCRR